MSYTTWEESTIDGSKGGIRMNNHSTQKVDGKYVHPTEWLNTSYQNVTGLVQYKNWSTYRTAGVEKAQPFGVTSSAPNKVNLINKAIANASDVKAQWGESFSEASQSAKMLASGAKSLFEFAVAMKAGKKADAARALGLGTSGYASVPKDLSDKYLAFQFGLIPLLQDIDSAYQLLADGIYATDRKKGMYVQTLSTDSTTTVEHADYSNGALNGTKVTTKTLSSRCVLLYRANGDDLFSRLDRYGLANPLLMGYQITRLSFLLDWFLPIGDFLQGLSSTHNLTYLDGYISTKGKTSVTIEDPWMSQPKYYTLIRLPSSKGDGLLREVVVKPTPRLPSFQFPDEDLGKALTMSALLLQKRG